MAETAISLLVFIAIILGGVDLLIVGFRVATTQYALNVTGRWATLGRRIEDPPSSGTFLNREQSIVKRVRDDAAKYGVDLSQADFEICPSTGCACSGVDCGWLPANWDAGGANDTITIRCRNLFGAFRNSIFPRISVSTVIRREP